MTFDQFRQKDPAPQDIVAPSKYLGMSLDEHFVNLLLFQAQLKIMHWGTESYAEHNAYEVTFDSVNGGLDALVESYQGYYGRLNFGSKCDFISFADVETNSWLGSMLECLTTLRNEFQESDLQNLADELIASVSKLKYLLTLK